MLLSVLDKHLSQVELDRIILQPYIVSRSVMTVLTSAKGVPSTEVGV